MSGGGGGGAESLGQTPLQGWSLVGKADLMGQIGKKSHLEKHAVEKVRQMFTIVKKKMLYKNFMAHNRYQG